MGEERTRVFIDTKEPPEVASHQGCVFCGGPLKDKAREHVIPQWILKELALADHVISPTHLSSDGSIALSSRTHVLKTLVLGDVCAGCNNGWMSQLEVTAAAPLRRLIGGSPLSSLTVEEKNDVGRWAFKTAVALNWASNYTTMIPPAHARAANPKGPLPDGVSVWGATHTPTSPFWWLQSPAWIFDGEAPAPEKVAVTWYKTTLSLGSLILTVCNVPTPYAPLAERGFHYGLAANERRVYWAVDSLHANLKTTEESVAGAHLGIRARLLP